MAFRRLNRFVHRYASANIERCWDAAFASLLSRKLSRAKSLEQKVDVAIGKGILRSNQRRNEILPLVTKVAQLKPRVVCEIGCDTGGTLALFAQCAASDAIILSLDIVHKGDRSKGFDFLAIEQQQVFTIGGSSYDNRTLAQVQQIVMGEPIDFLFIDGDHSLHGVFQDFAMYAPLLRQGSILAFHDIVPAKQINGVCQAYVGEVPEFFRDFIEPNFESERLVEDPSQSGYGIGVVVWPDRNTAARTVSKICRDFRDRTGMQSKAA